MDPTDVKSAITGAAVQSDKSLASASRKDKMDGKEELFKLNQLHYRIPPGLSLVSKRTLTKSYFLQQSYDNISAKQITMTVNTGEFYVSAPTSYLVITCGIDLSQALATDANARALLGNGDILNLLDEVYFQSASGTEIARETEKGLWNATVGRAMFSQEYLNTAGELSGWPGGTLRECYDTKGWPGSATINPWLFPIRNTTYNDTTNTSTTSNTYSSSYGSTIGSVDLAYDTASTTNPRGPKTFIVPMKRVLSCFAPYMNALFPAAALAGGTLTFRFKTMTEALIATGSALTSTAIATNFLNSLNILDISILWDSFQLNDSVLKRLNEVSAGKEGLSVMFDCWDWAGTQTQTLATEAQISQARSIISRSVCVLRDSAGKNNPFANSLAPEGAITRNTGYQNQYVEGSSVKPLVQTYQAQLGSLYFPQQPLDSPEQYAMNAYYLLGKNYVNTDELSSMTLDDFYGASGVGMYSGAGAAIVPSTTTGSSARDVYKVSNLPGWCINWGNNFYGFIAERNQLLQLTGLPISNARLLRHKFVFSQVPPSGKARSIDTFTQYARVMKVFLGGRIVMRE